MGCIKFKNEVLYSGPIAEFFYDKNWCDSMAEYYPKIHISFLENSEIKHKTIWAPYESQHDYDKNITIEYDEEMKKELSHIRDHERSLKEFKKIALHKEVIVVRGRKIPIGTIGEVFWLGSTKYGKSVGLRLLNGEKVFTAEHNV
mgnify:CR=1 FL=1